MISNKFRISNNKVDDTLFGLLSAYKSYNTYIRILVAEEKKRILVQLTSNPKYWLTLKKDDYEGYRKLRRLEIGVNTLFIKYIEPQHIIKGKGEMLGIKIPLNSVIVRDMLKEKKMFEIELPLRYSLRVFEAIKKIIKLKPQKKYELLEKYFLENQE